MVNYRAFLIKYGEIGIKGRNRYIFENQLVRQIEHALAEVEGEFQVEKEQGRIYIECSEGYDYDEAVTALKRVFGIVTICPVVIIESTKWEDMQKACKEYIGERFKGEHFIFKMMSRRGDKSYPMTSPEIAAEMGGYLQDCFPEMLTVDVHNPERYITLEVRARAYVYAEEIKGQGGMPLGSAGKGMLLLSGGIDSPVAGYMVAKRGVMIEAVYFHAPPYTSERAKKKVVDLAKQVSLYTGPIRLHVINFTDIQLAIYEKCPHEELTIIMRRYMMKIAQHLAEKNGCIGLITGESIGQVASQTMQSMYVTNAVCTMPVYRPLVALDKQDIVEISEKIGTYETSILPYEDCCTIFVAKHPVTKPELKTIESSEKKLNEVIDDLMAKAIESDEIITV